MHIPANFKLLFQFIDSDTTLLTPNRRLAATLHKFFHQYQLNNQQNAWFTPDILPLSAWLRRLWDQVICQSHKTMPVLLNDAQSALAWEKVIIANAGEETIFALTDTAELIQTAWGLLNQWQVSLSEDDFSGTEEYQRAFRCIQLFKNFLTEKNSIDFAMLPNVLLEEIGQTSLAKKIILVGFNDITPQLKSFLQACERTGCTVQQNTIEDHYLPIKRIQFNSQDHEIIDIARFAKGIYHSEKLCIIGCVFPRLDKIRERLSTIFHEVFAEDIAQGIYPFNISAGQKLIRYPIIQTAFRLLALQKKVISLPELCHILSSSFVGDGEQERISRAKMQIFLQEKNLSQINIWYNLMHQDRCLFQKKIPKFSSRLIKFYQLLNATNEKQTHQDWIHIFHEALILLGWPGERSLNSEEYQTVENWFKLLIEFVSLSFIDQKVSYQEALSQLQKMASKQIFQPQTPDARIQILGLLEASGLPFDYLWLAGLDDLTWPPKPEPNPFIPKYLQRKLKMPHASADRELQYCKNLFVQFQQNTAQSLIVSHAICRDDFMLLPSPLIQQIPETSADELPLIEYRPHIKTIFFNRQLERIVDQEAPRWQKDEKIKGGVAIIKYQAQCPFRAFAEIRLNARPFEKLTPGLRSSDRGSILHKALALIWNDLKNSDQLKEMADETLHQLIAVKVNEALRGHSQFYNDRKNYLKLEKKRLQTVIWQWLQFEKQRPDFKVVVREGQARLTLNQLEINLRIDRIDEIGNGQQLIIDYKTGKDCDINHWLSERPNEPQLPLYALLDMEKTAAISFAQIAAHNLCFKGLSSNKLLIKGIKPIEAIKQIEHEWIHQLSLWRDILTNLSDEFCQGVAKVDPKNRAETCLWCELKPLCRINEDLS